MAEGTLRVCALYPDLMNIYADRGNLLLFERRCAWRGIGFELAGAAIGDDDRSRRARPLLHRRRPGPRPGAVRADLVDRQARRAARRRRRGAVVLRRLRRLPAARPRLRRWATSGSPASASSTSRRVREDGPRLIGNVAIEVELPAAPPRCSPASRTTADARYLGAGERAARPRAARTRQRRPHGIEGVRGGRTARDRHVPARAAAAEERLVRRLADRDGAGPRAAELAPLDDALEARRARRGGARGGPVVTPQTATGATGAAVLARWRAQPAVRTRDADARPRDAPATAAASSPAAEAATSDMPHSTLVSGGETTRPIGCPS